MSHPWRASGAPKSTGKGFDLARDGRVDTKCRICGRHSNENNYGCCVRCLYNNHKAVHPNVPKPYRVIHDPEGCFSRTSYFTIQEWELGLKDGIWPDGLMFEMNAPYNRVGKVTLGDDGRERVTWFGETT